jgi:RNA polymerase sigma-70 factor (ECF subfamily)
MQDRRGLYSVPLHSATGAVEQEDFQLVRRFKYESDAAAFETLFRRHQQYIASLCLTLLRSQAEAEDAVQEVFIKVHRGLGAFEPTVTFRGWLYRIAVNHCRDLLEARARRNEESNEEALAALQTRPKQEAQLLATLTLEAALAKLKPEYRIAFVLQAVEGYSIAEVAAAMNIGFEAAASRLRRASHQFAAAYEALNRATPRGSHQR